MDKIQQMLVKMLKRSSFFLWLSDENILKFSNLFKLWLATKWQAIIVEGHIPNSIYVLKKWKLVAKKANWLNSVVLWSVQEWEVFGEMSFFNNIPAMASVVCESDTADYWEISRSDFKSFLDENVEIKTKIAETISKRNAENKGKLWWKLNLKSGENSDLDDIEINL